ncbi:hypothetical protein CPB86DRAFT_284864 [Serendipita vermifera]|nr:hypothetical protein CPB86DRAFT_284864 [Serendipita vermifera]
MRPITRTTFSIPEAERIRLQRTLLLAPRPLYMSRYPDIVECLGASDRLQPTGSFRHSGQHIFAFVHKCILIYLNATLNECPIERLDEGSLPLWLVLKPKEKSEWEALTQLLEQFESMPSTSATELSMNDATLWQKLEKIWPEAH